VPILDAPRFTEFAKRYLAEDVGHLAATTRQDRERFLRKSGPLLPFFGERRLDDITPGLIREWWNEEVIAKGCAMGTGGIYVDTLAAVLGYAEEVEVLTESPVPAFRKSLRRRARTQRGRAESEPGANITPVESPAEIQRIVRAAAREGAEALALVLLCLDAGLRLGETLGLAWGCIAWGEDEDDEGRALLIRQSRPRGGALGPPKSGRARRVALLATAAGRPCSTASGSSPGRRTWCSRTCGPRTSAGASGGGSASGRRSPNGPSRTCETRSPRSSSPAASSSATSRSSSATPT